MLSTVPSRLDLDAELHGTGKNVYALSKSLETFQEFEFYQKTETALYDFHLGNNIEDINDVFL